MNPKISFLAAAWWACALAAAHGQDTPLSKVPQGKAGPAKAFLPELAAAESTTTDEQGGSTGPRERFLLKLDDSILSGVIEDAGKDYCVRRTGNRILIAKDQVQTIGDSLADLYTFRAHRIPVHDLAMRLELARWCYHRGIIEAANAEAQLVLEQDPASKEAQRIVKLCQATLNPQARSSTGATSNVRQRKPRYPDPARVISQFKSAYGTDLFDDFQAMHGLLITSCARGGCHTATRHDGPFKLYYRSDRGPMDVRLTSRNLMSLLDAIDYNEPLRSPLLYKSLERHGRTSLPPLGGVQDATYLRMQQWVLEVARRWSGNEIEVDPRELAPTEPILGEDGEVFASGQAPKRKPEDAMVVRRIPRPEKPVLEPGDEVARIRSGPPLADDAPPRREKPAPELDRAQEKSSDPYDPASFNNRRPGTAGNRRSMDAADIVEMRDGRPAVKQTITLPGIKAGTFEAAAPPFNLLPTGNLNDPPTRPASAD